MQITDKLPQFEDENVLLVIASAHHSLIYLASGGEINQVYENKSEVPEYSDNEGMFKNSAGEGAYGSVLEPKKEEAIKELSKDLDEILLKEVEENNIKKIYLFEDAQIKGFLKNDLNKNIREIVVMTFDGNYTNETPLKLLEMINEKAGNEFNTPPTGEAADILDKTDDINL